MTLTPKQVSDMNIVVGASAAAGVLYFVGGVYYAVKYQKGIVTVVVIAGALLTTGLVFGTVALLGMSIAGLKIADVQSHMDERNNTNLIPSDVLNRERTSNV